MKTITFGNKTIGEGQPLYFIADIAANHDGSLKRALELITLAKKAGADAAKFQNFKAEKIVSKQGFEQLNGQLSHQKNWKKSVFEVYQDASISQDWTPILKQKCLEVGIDYFTSPYDFESIDHVNPYVDVYKIGSGDISWTEILTYIAKKGKPVMIATGASTMQDVVRAMNTLESHTQNIVLMQCNTNYTIDADKHQFVNLNVLKTYAQRFPNAILGLSDHTLNPATVIAAVALGARVFEKHFTDDNTLDGPDHKFSINPNQWREMVTLANTAYQSLGDGTKRVEENEKNALIVQRRCLRATRKLNIGDVLTPEDLEALRPIPQNAIEPHRLNDLIGKKIINAIEKGNHITWNDVS